MGYSPNKVCVHSTVVHPKGSVNATHVQYYHSWHASHIQYSTHVADVLKRLLAQLTGIKVMR